MKILYLHQYFKTPEEGGAIRSYHLAKALVKAGHQVEMISTHAQKNLEHRVVEGISVHYLPVPYRQDWGFWKRSRAFLKYLWQAYRLSRKFPQIDLIYASSTPLTVGLLAQALKKLHRSPYYFEVRDLWPEAPIEMGYIPSKLFQKLLFGLEKGIYKDAQKVIALSPGIQTQVKRKSPESEVHLIPNLADTIFFQASPSLLSSGETFKILYPGSMGKANHLEYLLDLAKYVQSQEHYPLPKLEFWIIGEGSEKQRLEKIAQKLGLRNLKFSAPLNKFELAKVFQQVQAVYISFAQKPSLQATSPNKYFDALAAAKIVLINIEGWLKDTVEAHSCGYYLDPQDPAQAYERLRKLILDPKLAEDFAANARNLAEEEFSLEVQIPKFLALFKPSQA